MPKTLKIIIMLPKREVNSWPKPEALLTKSVGGEGTTYRFPILIPHAEHYFSVGSGPIQLNERSAVEIMSAAKAELGAKAWTAFEGRMSEFWEVHKTDSTAYLFFSDYMDYGWEADIVGKFPGQGEAFRLQHSKLSDVARKGDYARKKRYPTDLIKKTSWNGLDRDDLEALRKAFSYFARTQKTLLTGGEIHYRLLKDRLAKAVASL